MLWSTWIFDALVHVECDPYQVGSFALHGVLWPNWLDVFVAKTFTQNPHICSHGNSMIRSQSGIWGLKRMVPLVLVFVSDFSSSVCISSGVHHFGMPVGNFSLCQSRSFFRTHGCDNLTWVWGEIVSALPWWQHARSAGQNLFLIPASFMRHSMILSL